MNKRTIATAFASVLAAGAAGLALAPSGAAAQEGAAIFLVPERGAAGPTGQEYILMLVPRQPGAGRFGPEAQQQQGRMGPGMMGPMMGQGPMAGQGPMMGQGPMAGHGPMMGQGPGMQGPMAETSDLERFAREMFERGYQMGRLTGQGFPGGPGGMVDLPPRYQEPGVTTFDRPGRFDVFRMPPPGATDQQQQVRQALREAQQALRQGEAQQAEQALTRIDRMLGEQAPGAADQERIRQALEDAEQALQRNDRQAAQEALRQARQAIGGQEQAGMTPTGGEPGQQPGQQGAGQAAGQQPTAARAQPQQQGQQQQGQQQQGQQ